MLKSDMELVLSTYVDGELDEKQTASVERLLSTHSDARRIVAELRALRSRLQALPRQSLGEDLTRRVLDKAEQDMLRASPEPLAASQQQQERTAPEPGRLEAWRRRLFQPRNWVYPILALSLAFAVALLAPEQPDRDQNGQVAVVEAPSEESQTTDGDERPVTDPANAPSPDSGGTATRDSDDDPPVPAAENSGATTAPATDRTLLLRGEIRFDGLQRLQQILTEESLEFRKVSGPAPDEETYTLRLRPRDLRILLDRFSAAPETFGRLDVPSEAAEFAAVSPPDASEDVVGKVRLVLRIRR